MNHFSAENDDLVALQEVRTKFNNNFKEAIESGAYDERDLARLRSDDRYAQCFIRHQHDDLDKAVAMIDSSLRWRKELQVNDLTDKSFPLQIHESGALYYHNCDKNGHQILHICVAKYKKNSETSLLIRKYVAWLIEKVFRVQPGNKIVVLFDMTDASLSNVDVELLKFQIACFTTYFPSSLAYILVYEMPWVLSAVWSVIKKLLTSAQQKFVLMVKKSQMTEYIESSQLLIHMGGTDSYVYSYIPSEDSGLDVVGGESDAERSLMSSGEYDGSQDVTLTTGLRKRVTFGETSSTTYGNHVNHVDSLTNDIPSLTDNLLQITNENTFCGSLVSIRPGEKLTFHVCENGGQDSAAHMTVTNIVDHLVTFKIKTTSPDSYRVKPHTGIIQAGASADVTVTLLAGHPAIAKDKFLVMVVAAEEDQCGSVSALNAFWKKIIKESPTYMEHRLLCHIEFTANSNHTSTTDNHHPSIRNTSRSVSNLSSHSSQSSSSLERKIDRMSERQEEMEAQIKLLVKLQLFTAAILLIVLLYALS